MAQAQVPGDTHRSVSELFRRAVAEVPGKVWLLAGDETWTYAQTQALVERAASGLRALGLGHGDRVMVLARNTPEFLFAWLGLMELGAVYVPVNPRSSRAELGGFVRQVAPAALVVDATLLDVSRDAVVAEGSPAAVVDVEQVVAHDPDGSDPAEVAPDDLAVLMPTSGTTGRSKLVMQTHRAYTMAGEGFPYWMRLTPDDRLMTSLPLFHVNATAYSTLGSFVARASLALLPGFSASGFLDSARHHGATEFNAIGAMLEVLMRQPERPDDAHTPLRLCYAGPSPARERHLAIEDRFGIEIVCGYGMSESTYGTIWSHGTRPYGTLGSLRQHPTLGAVNEGRVRDADEEGVGELELRNPTLMLGYYEMPEETASVLVDGWLRTGDLVHENPDHTFTFVGRRKEVIRRRGENLSPTEVEAALELHPSVAEAAVIGVPSDLSEEDVKAFVVAAPGAAIDPAGLIAHARVHLSRFKVPRYIEVTDELPHGPTGRVAKHKLPTQRTARELDLENGAPPV